MKEEWNGSSKNFQIRFSYISVYIYTSHTADDSRKLIAPIEENINIFKANKLFKFDFIRKITFNNSLLKNK